jgi:hypothetical protein
MGIGICENPRLKSFSGSFLAGWWALFAALASLRDGPFAATLEAGGSGTERRFFLLRITRIFRDFTDGEELGGA